MRYTEASWFAFQMMYAELIVELNPRLEPWEKPRSKAEIQQAWALAFTWVLEGKEQCDA